jgi:integrase
VGRPRKQSREPFWFDDRRAYYVTIGNKKKRLSPDRDEAWRLWHGLMANPPAPEKPVIGTDPPAVAILDAFLDWCQKNRADATYEWHKHFLQIFASATSHGLLVSALKPHHLTQAMDGQDWSNNTKHDFISSVQRAFNWAVDEGFIDRSPVARVKKPAREAKEVAASPDDYAEVMAAVAEPNFRQLIELAWETGARVQELRKIEARHVDGNRILLTPKEAKGKKYHRVIYLTERARQIIDEAATANPDGPLLRNSEGRPWTKDAINCAFCRVEKRIGRKLHLGAMRKGWVTEALKNGVDVHTAAHLAGHRDSTMLARVYARVQADPEFMARMAGKAKGSV